MIKKAPVPVAWVNPEDLYAPEFVRLLDLSFSERLHLSHQMWQAYLAYGGSLEPDPDPQSPFFDPETPIEGASDGRTGVHLIRRC